MLWIRGCVTSILVLGWEIKEDKYTESLGKNQVCVIFHMQDLWKNVLPKFINRHIGVPLGGTNMAAKNNKISVFELSYKSVNS